MKLHRIWLIVALIATLATTTSALVPVAAAKPVTTKPATQESATPRSTITASGANWTTYHYNNARSGYDPNEPSFTALGTGWTNSTLVGDIYAEPLVYGTTVYVVTEDNYLYALQDTTGVVLWSKQLSVPMESSGLPCGNISPHVGITSTPVIDPSLNRIYMVGMVATAHYVLWGVDLSTHTLVVNHVVDPANADVTLAQGQRGALALSQGLVYIPYGGRAGDCFSPQGHTYHGIVLGARRTDGAVLYRFQTNGRGAIWASGGESVDSTGHVYVAIGNGTPPDSERVFKLNPNLSRQNSWVPANQAALDSSDQDVGSIIPQLVGGGDIFQNGKSGDGYLLSSTAKRLQGPTHVCTGISSNASFGAAAYLSPYIYVPCSNGLYALKQTGNTFAAAWQLTGIDASPPIIAGGNVLVLDNNANVLHIVNAITGAPVTTQATASVTHFATPATGNGYVFVPAIGQIEAYKLMGCTSANMTPDVASPQPTGATITFTATSTGCSATPEYKFVLDPPGATGWTAKTGYGGANWLWDTTGLTPGVYGVGVWVRATGSSSQYESYWLGTYTLTFAYCANVSVSTFSMPPVAPGSTVPWSASAFGCGSPEYRFYVQAPGGAMTLKRDYGVSSWLWDTTGLPVGTYQVGVWARQIGSTHAYDAFNQTTFRLGSGNCTSGAIGAGPAPPQEPGAIMTAIGNSNSCTSPLYQFLLLPPGGTWTVMQAFGASATWNWNSTGYAPGYYQLGVWVKESTSTARYDAYAITDFQLKWQTCTSATITPSSASPQPPGTSITFTATSTGCANPRYRFWRLAPGSSTWVSLGAYSAGTTFVWDTTGLSGPYRFGVWARENGSTNSYDTYGQTTFWVGT